MKKPQLPERIVLEEGLDEYPAWCEDVYVDDIDDCACDGCSARVCLENWHDGDVIAEAVHAERAYDFARTPVLRPT